MSSNFQPRQRGPRPGYRGNYVPRNQMSDQFSHFPVQYTPPVRYPEAPTVHQFMPSPGTVTTVWDPSNFPSGAPRTPSVIMQPNRNSRPFFTPVPTQKSVTFTVDGRFVSSHSTLPLRRNDHDFPPLPGCGVPYQPINQPAYQPTGPSNFSFTVPNSGLLSSPNQVSLVPFQNPNHAHLDLSAMGMANGMSVMRPTPPGNGSHCVVNGPQWNSGQNTQQMYRMPTVTPFTVLPYDGNPSWQNNVLPSYGGNHLQQEPRGNFVGRTWNQTGGAFPRSSSERIASDIRLLPVNGDQVPYEQRGYRNGYFPGRSVGASVRPPRHFGPLLPTPVRAADNHTSYHPLPVGPPALYHVQEPVPTEANISIMSAEDLITRRMFREAALNIIKFARQNDFPLEVIAFPLLCCGNSSLLEKYVAKQPELQMRLMKLMEQLHCDNRLNRSIVREFARDYCRPQACGLHFQKLKKIATSWVHQFGIDPFEISSIYLDKCHAAIMYLIKNSTFEDISMDAWLENVDDLVKPFPDDLKAYTLNQLIFRKKDNVIMGRVMQLWSIDVWNGKMVADLLKVPHDTASSTTGQAKPEKRYYACPLERDAIAVVDSVEAFHDALTDLESQPDCILGIDCEWNSSRTGLEVAELALLQVATRAFCYLFDVFTLKQTLDLEDWRHLTAVFQSSQIVKLGFDFAQDMQMLKPFLPNYNGGYHENRIVDLKPLAEMIAEEYPDVFEGEKSLPDAPEPEFRFALASLVERVLGAPLSKLERMSNWESRPMREAQIVYAATDAHCLIEVYDKLAESCYARGIQFPPKSIRVRSGGVKKTSVTEPSKNSQKKSSGSKPSSPVDSANGSAFLENLSSPGTSSANGVDETPHVDDAACVPTSSSSRRAAENENSFETDVSF